MEARADRHLAFLRSILGATIDSPDSLNRAIIEAAQHLMPSVVLRLWRYDPDAEEFTMQASSVPTPDLLSRLSREDSFSGEAIESGFPRYYSDIINNPKLKNKEFVRQYNLDACWIIPIFLEHAGARKPYGTLAIYPSAEAGGGQLDSADVDILCALTKLIEVHAPILDQARLSSSLELGRRPEETTPQFWQRASKSIADALGFAGCTLFVADHTEARIRKLGGVGFDVGREHPRAVHGDDLIEYDNGLSATGYALESRRTVHSQNVYLEPWYSGKHKGLRSGPGVTFLATPIWDSPHSRIIGLIRCNDKRRTVEPIIPERINQDDIVRIEFIAKELSPIFQHYIHAEHNRVLWALASHDLKAPINVVRDAAGMILSHNPESAPRPLALKDRRDLNNIIDNTDILQLLVDMLATGAEDDLEYSFKRVPILGKSVTRIVGLLRPMAQDYSIRISYGTDRFTDFPALFVDRRRIEIALYNVIVNAIKYSYRKTDVEIFWAIERDSFSVSISNYGIGVPSEDRENIFRPFIRAANAIKTPVQGKGLGLYIVRRIMEGHSGSIELTQLHTPTVFTLRFPKGLRNAPPTKKSSNRG
jgi:signal transduction histidine kinase